MQSGFRFQNSLELQDVVCRRWAGVTVRCSTDCGTRKKSTSSSRITFRHSLSRTRVRHFVSLLPAFRFDPRLIISVNEMKTSSGLKGSMFEIKSLLY